MAPKFPPPFPVANSTLSFWRTELHALDSHRSTPELPSHVDILIIGAGFSGVSTAYHLLDNDNKQQPSIAILEAREACSGATGRNGGHIKPDLYFNVSKYAAKYGTAAAAEVALFEASQVYAMKKLVEKEKIDCDFILTRAIDATVDAQIAKESIAAYTKLSKEGVVEVINDVQYHTQKDAEGVSGVKGALCAFSFTAASIWPYKMVMHLLNLVVSKGVNLQTHTAVTEISETRDSDGFYTVKTKDRGSMKAKKIVFATNAYTAGIAPQFTNKIVPVRGICSRIVAPKETTPLLTTSSSVRYGHMLYDYLIPRADGSIVVGGAKQDFWNSLPHEWYGNVDDSKLIEPAKNYFDGYMQRTYRGWENSGAKVDKVWTGIMGYSSDYMPYVGHIPGKPGQLVVAGFSGHGMPLILRSTKGIADMILKDLPFKLTGVPRLFKVTKERMESQKNEILSQEKLARL